MTLDRAVNVLVNITLVEMMATIGLGVSIADIVAASKDWRFVTRAFLANYVVFPAATLVLLTAFESPPLVCAGFLIAAVCPGAPYGPPLTAVARGNVVLAVGLLVLLAGSSAFIAPILLPAMLRMSTGDTGSDVSAFQLVKTLFLAQFLPLCLGLAVRRKWPTVADRLSKPAKGASAVLNVASLSLIVVVQFEMLAALPFRAFAGMFLLIGVGVAAGWLLGGPANVDRRALVMATAVRNVGVTLAIATSAFPGTRAVVAATAFGVVQTIVMALVAAAWGATPTASKS